MPWSVSDAKSHLSEILRRARAGEPQIVGAQDPCVVISMKDFEQRQRPRRHMGADLLDLAKAVEADVELPLRGGRAVTVTDD